jgi:hypothetical protein
MTDGEITTIRDPCVGSIELKPDGESARRPHREGVVVVGVLGN